MDDMTTSYQCNTPTIMSTLFNRLSSTTLVFALFALIIAFAVMAYTHPA